MLVGERPSRCTGITAAICFLMLGGCVSSPSFQFDEFANAHGFDRLIREGRGFSHLLLTAGWDRRQLKRLHVYLDGDGTPWLGPGRPAGDPTPHNPLVLRLAALDPNPILYLGRPCYAGFSASPECHPWYWTHGRYSRSVVDSLSDVLRRVIREKSVEEVVLIGFSGGGTLAMLMADQIPQVRTVVTLAANLDILRWATLHGYSQLAGSLNPADLPALPPRIEQWHWVGELDRNVPPGLVKDGLARQHLGIRVRVLPGVDHRCCWEGRWLEMLREMDLTPTS